MASNGKNGHGPLKRTAMMAELEGEVGVAMTAFLYRQLSGGQSRSALADRLGVSPSTVARWGRLMGYGQRAVISAGWRSGLISQARYGGKL